jgi:hypothetical protein
MKENQFYVNPCSMAPCAMNGLFDSLILYREILKCHKAGTVIKLPSYIC